MYGHDRYHTSQYGFVPPDSVIINVTEEDDAVIAKDYALLQNYPNPFNPVTEIRYVLPNPTQLSLVIYNLLGEEVARLVDGFLPAGEYQAVWDASDAASGIYIYRLKGDDIDIARKMLLLK